MPMNEGMYSSSRDDWQTPPEIFDPLDAVFRFDLDPCADDHNHKCDWYFTVREDGLAQPWNNEQGNPASFFMNPPYGLVVKEWVKKAHEEWLRGCIGAPLVPARTDTRWFHKHVFAAPYILFLEGRINFTLPCAVCGTTTDTLYEVSISSQEKQEKLALCLACRVNPPPRFRIGKSNRSTAPFPSCIALFTHDKWDFLCADLGHLGQVIPTRGTY